MSAAPTAAAPGARVFWLVEYGACSLPLGHPSRYTALAAHFTEAEARADAQACDFDSRVFAVVEVAAIGATRPAHCSATEGRP